MIPKLSALPFQILRNNDTGNYFLSSSIWYWPCLCSTPCIQRDCVDGTRQWFCRFNEALWSCFGCLQCFICSWRGTWPNNRGHVDWQDIIWGECQAGNMKTTAVLSIRCLVLPQQCWCWRLACLPFIRMTSIGREQLMVATMRKSIRRRNRRFWAGSCNNRLEYQKRV